MLYWKDVGRDYDLQNVTAILPGLLVALGTVDAFLLHYAFNSVMAHGPTVQLVFGLEVSPYCLYHID